MRELTRGVGLDVAMECAGNDVTLRYALDSCRHFGHIALVGEHREGVATIDPSRHFLGRELTMTGTRYYHLSDYEEILALIEDGLSPERMITHRFPLERRSAGLRPLRRRRARPKRCSSRDPRSAFFRRLRCGRRR